MTRANISEGVARSPRGPIDGAPDTANSANGIIDLTGKVGQFLRIRIDPEASDYALFAMRASSSGTIAVSDLSVPEDQKGVVKLGAGDAEEWVVEEGNAYLAFKQANGTNVKFYYWLS